MSQVSFNEYCRELRERVDVALVSYLTLSSECPTRLGDSMRYSVAAGGKRLRPLLVLMACEACGGDVAAALPAAAAIEMIHTYSLIHDDLPAMDDDDLRRGMPTNHKQFDEATAILAGDGLLTLAFEILVKHVQPADVAAACVADLAFGAGPEGMVGGQMADLQAEHAGISSLEQLEAIHLRKTGRLLRAALTMGARIARADQQTLDRLDHFGKCVGLAFQITDDLLDSTGDATKMGKAVRKDATHGKLTYPGLLGLAESRQRAELLINEARHSIAPLGDRGQQLEALARFVLERDH